ncbi:MAG: GNAT family N-acetyltransferase [Thaumarchaeota archaeon]|nr:GNAT family N-acetyltransferase [Nitrososphaerota archaeon]
MSQQILLKKAEKEDWTRILQLYSSLDEVDLEYRFFNLHRVSADEAKIIAGRPDHFALLALQGESAIGEATLQGNGEVSVVVQKQSRGMGVARLLVTELIDIARSKGFKKLRFFTLPSNSKMVGLGRAFGFRVLSHSSMEEEWILDL